MKKRESETGRKKNISGKEDFQSTLDDMVFLSAKTKSMMNSCQGREDREKEHQTVWCCKVQFNNRTKAADKLCQKKNSHSHTYNPHTVLVTEAGPKLWVGTVEPGETQQFLQLNVVCLHNNILLSLPFWYTNFLLGRYHTGHQQNHFVSVLYIFLALPCFILFCLLAHSLYQGLSHFVCIVLLALAHYIQSPNALLMQGYDASRAKNFLEAFSTIRNVLNVNNAFHEPAFTTILSLRME